MEIKLGTRQDGFNIGGKGVQSVRETIIFILEMGPVFWLESMARNMA